MATTCNLAMASSPEEASHADLYVLSGFGGIVILLTVAVWWLTFYVKSTLTTVFAFEKNQRELKHGIPSPIKNLPIQAQRKTSPVRRWAVIATLTSLVLVTGVLVIYGRNENAPASGPAPEGSTASAVVFQPSSDQAVIEKGKGIFQSNCTPCHGPTGAGNQVGPNLTDDTWIHGGQPDSVFHTINHGVASKGMPAWGKTMVADDVRAVASFVLTLRN